MHDVISIGSSLVDIFITSKDFQVRQFDNSPWLTLPFAEKSEVNSFEVCTGGGASNTAVGFARMGLHTGVISELGTDSWSKLLWEDFQTEGVDTSLIIQEKLEQTGGSVILLSQDGERTVMVYRGAASMLDPHDIAQAALAEAGWVHLSSIAGRQAALQTIFSTLKEHKRQFSWNPGKQEIKLLVEGGLSMQGLMCAVLLVNKTEWQALSPIHQQVGNWTQYVVVTDGPHGGAVWQQNNQVVSFQAKPVTEVNQTGAGDSFAVGFVTALIKGEDIDTAVKYGSANAASVVQHSGAKRGLLTFQELQDSL